MLRELKNELNVKETFNGALTNSTSDSKVLDYFCQCAALRERTTSEKIELFLAAYEEDELLALKTLFYSRDIKAGGERQTFREIIHFLAKYDPYLVKKNIDIIPELGRYDDLYALYGTECWEYAVTLIKYTLDADLKSEHPTLLAKWLKSENTSSEESRKLAKATRKGLGLSSKAYRKILSKLRKKIKLVETALTERKYDEIEYSKVPGKAMLLYRNAFIRNDEERYSNYLEALNNNDSSVKINTSTVYPYELVRKVLDGERNTELINAMWDNLPNYIGDDTENSIAVVDTSGSMCGTPLNMAIGLGLYLAERNNGHFKNHFITFSKNPDLVEIKGNTFAEKVLNIESADWGMNTDIKKTFDLILNTAKKYNLSQEDIPSRLFVISDMEFDSISNDWGYGENPIPKWNETLFQTITREFKEAGYEMPKLVFWNVNAMQTNIPLKMEDNVQLVSGANASLFEKLLQNKELSAYDFMLEVLNDKRYDNITI